MENTNSRVMHVVHIQFLILFCFRHYRKFSNHTIFCVNFVPVYLKITQTSRIVKRQWNHRRRRSVNFRGARHFCPKNMYEKLTKCPNFTRFLPEKLTSKLPEFLYYLVKKLKLTKFLNFTWFFSRKMPEFYIIIARKIFLSEF